MNFIFEETKIECTQLCSLIESTRKHSGSYRRTSIKIIVEDAIRYRQDPECLHSLRREELDYSLTLGRSNLPQLMQMKPDNLTDNELELLLNFFSSL